MGVEQVEQRQQQLGRPGRRQRRPARPAGCRRACSHRARPGRRSPLHTPCRLGGSSPDALMTAYRPASKSRCTGPGRAARPAAPRSASPSAVVRQPSRPVRPAQFQVAPAEQLAVLGGVGPQERVEVQWRRRPSVGVGPTDRGPGQQQHLVDGVQASPPRARPPRRHRRPRSHGDRVAGDAAGPGIREPGTQAEPDRPGELDAVPGDRRRSGPGSTRPVRLPRRRTTTTSCGRETNTSRRTGPAPSVHV